MEQTRIFLDVPEQFYELPADGVTDWIQIFPRPGVYTHPGYGKLEITPGKLQRMADSFAKRVYQEHIPVDAEHQTKLSGALGYYREVEARDDGLFARIALTDRGKKLVGEDRFKYFSAELWPTWSAPEGGEHKDVLIGGAFTSRPFFKDTVQRPIAASELEAMQQNDESTIIPSKDEEQQTMTEPNTQAFTELQERYSELESKHTEMAQKYSELETANKALSAEATAAKKESESYSERIAALENAARHKRFTDLVTGHGGAGDGQHWFGEPEQHVSLLTQLAQAFGEDSDAFKNYVAQQEKTASAVAASVQSTSGGRSPLPAENGIQHKFDAAVAERMTANPALSRPQALAEVIRSNPQLYSEYTSARPTSKNKE